MFILLTILPFNPKIFRSLYTDSVKISGCVSALLQLRYLLDRYYIGEYSANGV